MTKFEMHLPHPHLRPYIKMYFWGRDAKPPLAQRVVPNGEMGMMFYRTDDVKLDGVQRMCSCVKGQSMRYHDIVAQGSIDIVGAHFTMLGAQVFLKAPLSEYFETTVELADIEDAELKELEKRVADAADHHECWQWMEAFFLRRLSVHDADILNLRRLQRAIAYGQQHAAGARIGDIASEACLSQRQFGRLFSDMVGLSPKDFIRLRRYHQAVLDLKRHHGTVPMATIAWRNGYYDVSHLSSDFRKLTGFSPARLLEVSKNDGDTIGWRI